jgi:hypothetical protein
MVEVTKEGFNKYAQTGIVLQVDTNPTVDVSMQVGAVSEQVTVEAGAAQVETRSTSIGQVVDNQRVAEMPLNGRDPHELIFLAGMANYPGAGSINTIRNYPTVVVSVAGGVGDSVSYLLDGAVWQDPYNSLSMPLPFPDALQEFKVETSAVPAQYGYHSGATVNVVTKSGTNAFHGDAFEFLRNGDLNARDFFASRRDTLKRNQFGGVLGGPIKKDKLFFFGGYQRTSVRSDPNQNTDFIPTPAMVAGDFTAITSPTCNNGRQITLPAALGFANNRISPTSLNSVALNIVKTLPTPTNDCGRVLSGQIGHQDENLTTAKVDWQASEKNSFFVRYMVGALSNASTYDGKDPLSISSYGYHDLHYGVSIGNTYLLGPNLVSSFHLGANRTNVQKIPDNYKSWQDLGANVTPLAGNIITVTATGAFLLGSGAASPGAQHNGPLWSIGEELNWVKGTHQFSFGGNIYQQRLNYFSGVNAVGTATFTGNVTGLILGDFMLGRPNTFAQGTVYGFYTRQYYASLYAQDTWKLNSRLTLNYGVRWEPYLSYYNNRGENEHFDFGLFAQNVHSSVFTNAPAGLFFPGDSQWKCGDYFNCPVWNKFFPRVGLAWDPTGSGKMTIRAGYGMYGDRPSMLAGTTAYFAPPFGNQVSQAGASLTDPWAPGTNPMPALAAAQGIGVYGHNVSFPLAGSYLNSNMTDFHPMYLNQWNLSIQRQVGKDWLVSANYLGNSTIHLVSGEPLNPAVFLGTGPCTLQTPAGPVNYTTCSTTANQNQRRILYLQNPTQGQYYAGIGIMDDGGTGSYEGMYLSSQKRLSHGFTVLANYTWSHCISDVYNQNPGNGGVAPYNNRRQFRGQCIGSDLRQLFQVNVVATTPKFSNRWMRIVAGGWQVAPILQIKSAQEFTVFSGTDRALTTVGNQTPNLVNTNPYPSNKSVNGWINASAFANPDLGTYGNLGYNNMKGPGVFQLNMALSRNFVVKEGKQLQIRAEAFNLPNHLNPFAPGVAPINAGLGANVALTAPNFGQITNDISGNNGLSPGDYRVIQLAMKFLF